jgi:single-strand selective monofunctional uracil DNA glycosylase
MPALELKRAAEELCRALAPLRFGEPVTHVYNPLRYARRNHDVYVERYGFGPKRAVFVGMNPGPWGMAQTGVPFGDPGKVRSFLGIDNPVERPAREHPKRPVLGLDCPRSEVSGTRVWDAVERNFGTAERFFERFYIANYCPLCFMEASGRNRVPEKLPLREREALFAACDEHLRRVIHALQPRHVVGVGAFAARRAQVALEDLQARIVITQVLHPSPASPAANQDWGGKVARQLADQGICVERGSCADHMARTK